MYVIRLNRVEIHVRVNRGSTAEHVAPDATCCDVFYSRQPMHVETQESSLNVTLLPVRVISFESLSMVSTASAPSSQASMKNFSGLVCLREKSVHPG